MKNCRIGLTFDLRESYLAQGYSEIEAAEFDGEQTIISIERNLKRLGYHCERVGNAKDLMRALNEGARWDMVFNICEGSHGTGREALVPAILDSFEIPYAFSDPLALTLTLHKFMAKRVMRDIGIPTAPFALVEQLADIDRVDLPFPLFAKPVCEGTSKGIDASCHVNTPEELRHTCQNLLNTYQQPVLVERYLPGREFTVGMLGTGETARAFAGMEIIPRKSAEPFGYTYHNKQEWESLVDFRALDEELLNRCSEVALPAWRGLQCRDAGRIDLREDDAGRINVLEINPLPGMNEAFSDLAVLSRLSGFSYTQLFDMIMDSVVQRLGIKASAGRKTA